MRCLSGLRHYLLAASLLYGCGGTGPGPVESGILDTFITSGPDEYINVASAAFEFISDGAASAFEGSIDGGPFFTVVSPFQLNGLSDGPHIFAVRALDVNGNPDATPATHSWTVDTVNPSSFITFPTLTSLTDADAITIRGGTNEAVGVANLRIAGVDVTTTDNFQTWRANLPLVKGTNIYFLESTDLAGNTDAFTDAIIVRNLGYVSHSAYTGAIDSSGSSIFVMDNERDAAFSIDLATGYRQVISGLTTGSGPVTSEISDLVLDEANNRIVAADVRLDQVFAININTGVRTILSDATPGLATSIEDFVYGIAYDAANNRIFAAIGAFQRIVQINLTDGSRSIIASNTIGNGDAFQYPREILYDDQTDPANPVLYVIDTGALYRVDPVTGNRSVVSAAVPLDSVTYASLEWMKLDAVNNRILTLQTYLPVSAPSHRKLVAINLTGGARTDIANNLALDASAYWPLAFNLSPDNQIMYTLPRNGRTVYSQSVNATQVSIASDLNLGSGPKIGSPVSLNLVPGQNELIATDANRVIRIDTRNGNRSVIADEQTGSGTNLFGASAAAVDTQTNPSLPRLLVYDYALQTLFGVDLANGNRTIISSPTVGTGYLSDVVVDIAFDNNRVIALDHFTGVGAFRDRIFDIELATGNRTIISGLGTGVGDELNLASALTLDNISALVSPRLLVSNRYMPVGMFSVNPVTGDRSLFSTAELGVGQGIAFVDPYASVIYPLTSELIVADSGLQALVGVNLSTGNRRLVSGTDLTGTVSVGDGIELTGVREIDINVIDSLAYVNGSETIVLVDLLTGERVIISL